MPRPFACLVGVPGICHDNEEGPSPRAKRNDELSIRILRGMVSISNHILHHSVWKQMHRSDVIIAECSHNGGEELVECKASGGGGQAQHKEPYDGILCGEKEPFFGTLPLGTFDHHLARIVSKTLDGQLSFGRRKHHRVVREVREDEKGTERDKDGDGAFDDEEPLPASDPRFALHVAQDARRDEARDRIAQNRSSVQDGHPLRQFRSCVPP